MAPNARDEAFWRDIMNKASDLFDCRRLDMCLFEMQRLLGYDECPIYYRMQGHAMLASTLDSWYEAEVSGLDQHLLPP